VVHFTVAFTIAYLLTGSIGIASALALIEAHGEHGRVLLSRARLVPLHAALHWRETRLASTSK